MGLFQEFNDFMGEINVIKKDLINVKDEFVKEVIKEADEVKQTVTDTATEIKQSADDVKDSVTQVTTLSPAVVSTDDATDDTAVNDEHIKPE